MTTAADAAMSTGTPAGTNGTATRASTVATAAVTRASLACNLGHSRARNAATAAPSSP